ncbi:MAG: MoaD/ThiS family protein [Clostridia bacterium]
MARITVKLFGQFRLDAGWAAKELEADSVKRLFEMLMQGEKRIERKRAIVYVNKAKCSKMSFKLADGDEVWLLGAAYGG